MASTATRTPIDFTVVLPIEDGSGLGGCKICKDTCSIICDHLYTAHYDNEGEQWCELCDAPVSAPPTRTVCPCQPV